MKNKVDNVRVRTEIYFQGNLFLIPSLPSYLMLLVSDGCTEWWLQMEVAGFSKPFCNSCSIGYRNPVFLRL